MFKLFNLLAIASGVFGLILMLLIIVSYLTNLEIYFSYFLPLVLYALMFLFDVLAKIFWFKENRNSLEILRDFTKSAKNDKRVDLEFLGFKFKSIFNY